jgi:hypothetical protein
MLKEASRLQSRISAMALVGCWALLLLTTNPLPALAGRHDPSATAQENNKMIKHKVVSHQLQQVLQLSSSSAGLINKFRNS